MAASSERYSLDLLRRLSRKFSGLAAAAAESETGTPPLPTSGHSGANLENGHVQMQHVSKALATRLHDIAR